eukprot:262745-Amorphochlora_amoeboformis.AAC.1
MAHGTEREKGPPKPSEGDLQGVGEGREGFPPRVERVMCFQLLVGLCSTQVEDKLTEKMARRIILGGKGGGGSEVGAKLIRKFEEGEGDFGK